MSLEKGAKLMLNKLIPTNLQSELNMKGNRGKNAFGHTKLYICLRGKNLFFIMEQFLTWKMLFSKYEVVLFQSLVRGSDELISQIEDVKIYSIWSSWNCLPIAAYSSQLQIKYMQTL